MEDRFDAGRFRSATSDPRLPMTRGNKWAHNHETTLSSDSKTRRPNRRNNWPGAKYLKLFIYLPITKVLLATSWPGAKYLKQTCMQKGVDAKQCRQLKVQPDLGRAIGHALLYIDFLTVREALPRIPDCSN